MLLALMSALLLQPATAPAPACAATDQDLPASLNSWRTPTNAATTVQPGQTVTYTPTTPLILVINGGGVTELGDHDQLLRRDGLYAELYLLQARSYA